MDEQKRPGAYSGYTEARKAANARYEAETVERISLVLKKGQKAEIKAHAESNGESVNGFINRAITEAMERDSRGTSPEALLSALRESLHEDEKIIKEIDRIADDIYSQLNELKKA